MQPEDGSETPRDPVVLEIIERWRRKMEKYGRYPREYQSPGENGSRREDEEADGSGDILICLEQALWDPREWGHIFATLYGYEADGYDVQRMYEAAAHQFQFVHEREARPWSEVKAELEERRPRLEEARRSIRELTETGVGWPWTFLREQRAKERESNER